MYSLALCPLATPQDQCTILSNMCANTSGLIHIKLILISALNKALILALNKALISALNKVFIFVMDGIPWWTIKQVKAIQC